MWRGSLCGYSPSRIRFGQFRMTTKRGPLLSRDSRPRHRTHAHFLNECAFLRAASRR
jgi:hypothetical protein